MGGILIEHFSLEKGILQKHFHRKVNHGEGDLSIERHFNEKINNSGEEFFQLGSIVIENSSLEKKEFCDLKLGFEAAI